MSIHPTAVIEKGAQLGERVTIGPFAFIDDQTSIGDGAIIGPHAVVHRFTSLGPGCRVHAGAVLGDWPQDLAFKGDESYLRIGAHCTIREGVTLHRGTKPGTETVVGDGCFLMANSHLAHNVRLGTQVILANGVLLAGYVEVGDRAFISGNVVVHQFTRIGRLAMMQGMSGVSKDVPPFCVVPGLKGNVVGGLNVVGMRRAGLTPAQRKEIKEAYVILYRSGLNVSQALDKLKAKFPSGPAQEFWSFVEGSKRGICRASAGPESGDEE